MKKLYVIAIILVMAIVAIFLYSKYTVSTDATMTYSDFTILEGHSGKIEKYDASNAVEGYKGGSEAYYISGKVKASSDKGFTLITFNLYDKEDNLLGTAVAGLKELKKDKAYDFKAVSLIEYEKVQQIDHYNLESIK